MFRRLSEALPLSEASLLAMRPALNAPVLNVGFLPVGPARAAIVVFGEEWGGIGFALGIRSNEGGQVAVFRNQVSLEPDVPIPDVLEPVLAEAERMGFLFDEDMMDTQPASLGRERAMALWGRLMGEIEIPTPSRVIAAEPATSEPIIDRRTKADRRTPEAPVEELVLDEVAAAPSSEISLDHELEAAPAASAAPEITQATEPFVQPEPSPQKSPAIPRQPAPPVPPQSKLSKFRHADRQPDARKAKPGEANEGGSELGRIPIVKIRREREGAKRIPYLARLLSSF